VSLSFVEPIESAALQEERWRAWIQEIEDEADHGDYDLAED
jgi:hypothetical protein